jgi:hypothetical protein
VTDMGHEGAFQAVLDALDAEHERESKARPAFRLVVDEAPGSGTGYGPSGEIMRRYVVRERQGQVPAQCKVVLSYKGGAYPAQMRSCRDGIATLEAVSGGFLPRDVTDGVLERADPDYGRKLREALERRRAEGLSRHARLLLDPLARDDAAQFEYSEMIPEELTREQGEALALALGSDLTVVQGPPGVGKSYCLARTVSVARMIGYRVLVTARSQDILEGAFPHILSALEPLGPGERPLWVGSGRPHSLSVDEAMRSSHAYLFGELAAARARWRLRTPPSRPTMSASGARSWPPPRPS